MVKLVDTTDGSERAAEKNTGKFCGVGSSPTMSIKPKHESVLN